MEENLNCELIQSIFQLKKIFHKGFSIENIDNKVSISEIVIMNEIIHNTKTPGTSNNNIDIADIKEYLSISKGAVSQKLSSLEKKGYIQRTINENNRRNLIITLTPKGKTLMKNHYSKFSNKLEKIVNRLGQDNVREIIQLVNKMTEITNEINNDIENDEKSLK